MGVQLLDKTRKINKLLHNNSSSKVVFNDICEVLTEILDSNVLVISKKGKVLGGSKCEGVPYITELIEREIGKHVDDMLNERLLSILSTKENVRHLDFPKKLSKVTRRSLHLLTLPENDLEHFLFIKKIRCMKLTTLF